MLGRLNIKNTAFLLCDIQTGFEPLIYQMNSIANTSKYLLKSAGVMNIPVICTEHYPKALGRTIQQLDEFKKDATTFEKVLFSMTTEPMMNHLESIIPSPSKDKPSSVVLFGIETHVCIQQTCFALINKNYDVHIIADGVSSQRAYDRHIALERMRDVGAHVTTAESALFELMGGADYEKFKIISKLTKERNEGENKFDETI